MSDKLINKNFQVPDRLAQYSKNNEQYRSKLITDTSMLSDDDRSLVEMSMNKEWSNPKYKLKQFVGQAQITPFAKVRQWILEIKSREETIEQLEYEIAKWAVEIDRQKSNIENAPNDFDRRLAELELKNVEKNHVKSHRRLNDWYLERQQLIDLVNEFLTTDEAKLPDGTGRTYLDILNTDEEDIYEAEYWTNRLGKQAACDLLFYGRVSTGNMDAILQMDPRQQSDTLNLAITFASSLQKIQNEIQIDVDKRLGVSTAEFGSGLHLPTTTQKDIDRQGPMSIKAMKDGGEDLDVYNS